MIFSQISLRLPETCSSIEYNHFFVQYCNTEISNFLLEDAIANKYTENELLEIKKK